MTITEATLLTSVDALDFLSSFFFSCLLAMFSRLPSHNPNSALCRTSLSNLPCLHSLRNDVYAFDWTTIHYEIW